jgi:hypothetical protein
VGARERAYRFHTDPARRSRHQDHFAREVALPLHAVLLHKRVAPLLQLFRSPQGFIEAFEGSVETAEREPRAREGTEHDRAYIEE